MLYLLFRNFKRETLARNPRPLYVESDLNFTQIFVPSEKTTVLFALQNLPISLPSELPPSLTST